MVATLAPGTRCVAEIHTYGKWALRDKIGGDFSLVHRWMGFLQNRHHQFTNGYTIEFRILITEWFRFGEFVS